MKRYCSQHFLHKGHLFGALSRSFWTLLVFVFALWTPCLHPSQFPLYPENGRLWRYGGLISCAVLSVHRVLMQKSYFGPLDPPRLLVHGNRPGKNLTPPDSQSADQGRNCQSSAWCVGGANRRLAQGEPSPANLRNQTSHFMVTTGGSFRQEDGPLAVDESQGWARPAPAPSFSRWVFLWCHRRRNFWSSLFNRASPLAADPLAARA